MIERGASYDEASIGKQIRVVATTDMKRYRRERGHMHGNAWLTGCTAKNAGSTNPQTMPYDFAILDVLKHGMKTGDVIAAMKSKHPSVDPPDNMSQALVRLARHGHILRLPKGARDNHRHATWGPLE